jgi:hypothetical protein
LVVDSAAPCWGALRPDGDDPGPPRRTLEDAVTIAVPPEQVFRGLRWSLVGIVVLHVAQVDLVGSATAV